MHYAEEMTPPGQIKQQYDSGQNLRCWGHSGLLQWAFKFG